MDLGALLALPYTPISPCSTHFTEFLAYIRWFLRYSWENSNANYRGSPISQPGCSLSCVVVSACNRVRIIYTHEPNPWLTLTHMTSYDDDVTYLLAKIESVGKSHPIGVSFSKLTSADGSHFPFSRTTTKHRSTMKHHPLSSFPLFSTVDYRNRTTAIVVCPSAMFRRPSVHRWGVINAKNRRWSVPTQNNQQLWLHRDRLECGNPSPCPWYLSLVVVVLQPPHFASIVA